MDKRLILAVAGSGKTTYIVNSLSAEKRSLIITYTDANYENLCRKIAERFNGAWPENVTLMKYFQFLYRFCYKPFLSDRCKAKGIIFDSPQSRSYNQRQWNFYMTQKAGYFYSNRLSLFLEKAGVVGDIKERIETYFDEFIIDEVQDIAGRDFNLLMNIVKARTDMLFVGDFFQHTYDTSRDGNVNQSLFNDREKYIEMFKNNGITPDTSTLGNSWRCSKTVCDFISRNLGINIKSNRQDDTEIRFVTDEWEATQIINNKDILKMHIKDSKKYGLDRRNWGATKGEDCYQDVCIMLSKENMKRCSTGKLNDLKSSTKNKLYVAITRAHGNVYFIQQ